jgi:adenosylmethionine-8-amino-7-oxononanoate aminotransferase
VELDAAALVDDTALEHGLLVTSTHPQADGYAGDQVLLAPAYVATDDELGQMVERFRDAIADVERTVKQRLAGGGVG